MLFSILSYGSGLIDDRIMHLLSQHAAGSFWKEFEAIVGEVIDEVLVECFKVAFWDSEDVEDS